jgi:hypothetical protein
MAFLENLTTLVFDKLSNINIILITPDSTLEI